MHKNVFEKSNAIGGLGYSLANPPCDVDEEVDIEDRFLHPGNGRSDDDEEAFQDYIGGQHSGSKRAGPSSGRGRGWKKRTTDADLHSHCYDGGCVGLEVTCRCINGFSEVKFRDSEQ